MHTYILAVFCLFVRLGWAQETKEHGEGAEGTEMGPVAFLWPDDRLWNATNDNTGPCGSPNGPSNRTSFPLTQGSVALTVADEAWNIAFSLALSNDPKTQSDFSNQVVDNVTEIAPGHQCYKLEQLKGITAGTNATIQMEYWSEYEGENNGKNQSFFACADITFVDAADMTITPPCFNVTSDDFITPTPSSTSSSAPTPTAALSESSSSAPASSSKGLSKGAIAGIVIGSLIGGLALIGAIAFFVFRRGKATGLKGKEEYELRAQSLSNTPPASGKP
ncbi:hypothetical protein K505DRAFT_407892 [Melanomma pulvis-pyrius CBS 109.77]|uniref:Copper acquisition factor BIM1-like domain-containing protein n=1 Tax=Melanomma pulvis-pyrius CBS 109.77 TaxID=1314802 RepID=A0A6A6XBD0_9PLEO|nr:hypothetical protein K505DRAFT_407892 [Melanomma pulvis-pyrius CBS 109.77]